MTPDLFNKMYIATAAFSFQYEPNMDIERELIPFEDGLKNLFDDRSQLTRVPRHADPQIPRFVFQNKSGKRLEVSPVRSILTFNFKGVPIDRACSLLKKNTEDLFSFLRKQSWINIDGFKSTINIPLCQDRCRLP